MTSPVRPALYVDPPAVEPYEHGLFGAAQPLGLDDPHWLIGGIEWESLASYPSSFYAAGQCYTDPEGERATKAWSEVLGVSSAWPFGVYAGLLCGTFGHTPSEVEARARRVLELSAQHAAETALWTGTGDAAVDSLNSVDSIELTTAAVSIAEALRLGEDWLADNYNGRGLVHAQRGMSVPASQQRLVKCRHVPTSETDTVDELVTPVGTRWVFGGGYDGSGPGSTAAPAGTSWVYFTGQVVIVAGPEFSPATFEQAISRIDNQDYYVAERPYLIGIDGPVAAAQVTYGEV